MFLQEGALYRVNLDGSGLEKLTDTYLSSFYVYEEEGTPMLLYNQDANLAGSGGYPGAETPTGNAVCYCMNLDTGETSSVSKPVGPVGKVFSDGEGNYWVYPDLSGTPVSVISAEEGYSKGSLGTSADGEEISYIDTVFLSGDRAYFTVIQAERSRELDVGWRSGFRRISSALYCKDIHTGEVELLYTY